MKYYDKFSIPFSAAAGVPRPTMQIAEASCFHCGRVTRFPVKAEFIDWEKVAESYRKRLGELMHDFEQIGRDVEVMHGENPAAEYVANRLRMALIDVRRKMDDHGRESGT